MSRQLLSSVDAGVVFDVHEETLRRLWRAGKIPGYKVGRYLRFDPDEVREALRSNGPSTARSARVQPDFDALTDV